MNEHFPQQPSAAEASSDAKKRLEIPKPRSDCRPAGERLAGVLRLIKEPWKTPLDRGAHQDEVDLLHPDVSIDTAKVQDQHADEVASPDAEVSGASTSPSIEESPKEPPVQTPVSSEVKDDPPVVDATHEADPPVESEHAVESEVTDEDRAVVKASIRDLQKAGKCPDGCFPLNQADLDRLAHIVHGVANDNAEHVVLAELQEIEKARAS